jgi:tripartite-type tricarboxylate transporter receptor subunit TctC
MQLTLTKPWRLNAAVALLALTSLCGAQAQSYPNKPIRWIVPSTPGDGSDSTGRLIADQVSRELGQPVVIDNKPGAGGVLGSEAAAKAPADGYTMIVGNAGSHGINAAIYSKLNYDVVKDFSAVGLICTTPNVMVVGPSIQARTVAEFVALAKASGGKLNYASGGVGSSAHLSAELFKSLTGVEMTHIPYKGTSPAVAGVLSGEVAMMIGNLPPWSAQIKAGRVHALAVSTAKRHPSMPDVPALAETYPQFETVAWFGVLAPAGTPPAIIGRVNAAINKALAQPEVKARLATMGCDPAPGTAESFAARIQSDVTRWKKLATEKQIRAD